MPLFWNYLHTAKTENRIVFFLKNYRKSVQVADQIRYLPWWYPNTRFTRYQNPKKIFCCNGTFRTKQPTVSEEKCVLVSTSLSSWCTNTRPKVWNMTQTMLTSFSPANAECDLLETFIGHNLKIDWTNWMFRFIGNGVCKTHPVISRTPEKNKVLELTVECQQSRQLLIDELFNRSMLQPIRWFQKTVAGVLSTHVHRKSEF